MDHVILVDKNIFPPITFPFKGELWDGGSFNDYPERRGYDTSTHTFYAEGVENSKENSYHFYHTWLYLGVLADAFGCTNVNEQFLKHDPELDCQVLTTESLNYVIGNWRAWVNSLELGERITAIERNIAVIQRVNDELIERYVPTSAHRIWDKEYITPEADLIRFSIALLNDSLQQGFVSFEVDSLFQQIDRYNSKAATQLAYPNFPRFRWQNGEVLLEAMKDANLCPLEIEGLDLASPSYLCYLLSLPNNGRHDGQHKDCTASLCVGNNVDEKTYVTKHVTDDCDCEHDGPDIGAIAKCLRDGHIPSVELVVSGGEYQYMRVKPQKVDKGSIWKPSYKKAGLAKSLDFVALSHVWADGLGNPFKNTLPRCQLRRLAYYARYTMDDGKAKGFFGNVEKVMSWDGHVFAKRHGRLWEQDPDFQVSIWNDTMCVPLDDDLRKLAIKNMNQVYRQARYVMILDASVAAHNYNSDLEVLGRIVISSWMRRVWTLQEAVLGMEKLAICLANDVVDHVDSVERLRSIVVANGDIANNPLYEMIAILGDDSFAGLNGAAVTLDYGKGFSLSKMISRGGFDMNANLEKRKFERIYEQIWALISRRATTKEADRVLVASNILYKDTDLVLAGKGHEGRLSGLIPQLDEVPAGCIFHPSERLPTPGMRWAPLTFGTGRWGRLDLDNPGKVTPQGLRFKSIGVVFPKKPDLPSLPVLIGRDNRLFNLNFHYPNASDIIDKIEYWQNLTKDAQHLALIWDDSVKNTFRQTLEFDGELVPVIGRHGVLVALKGQKSGILYCDYLAYGYIAEPPGPEYSKYFTKRASLMNATDLKGQDQYWCVG